MRRVPLLNTLWLEKSSQSTKSVIEAAVANHSHRGSIRNVATKKFKQLDGFVYRYGGDVYRGRIR